MSVTLKLIRILSDGRPGHFNQSYGLAEALQRRTGARIECVTLDLQSGFLSRLQRARAGAEEHAMPELIIAAGHRTHGPLIAAARRFKARSVVIMKPSLPSWCFDLCLVPRHDLDGAVPRSSRVVVTRGALNRLPEELGAKKREGVILIGGPSKHHDWDGEPVLRAISAIVKRGSERRWQLTNSRRTPAEFLAQVAALGLPLTLVPHEQTVPGWLPAQLMAAEDIWVTEDSTSMVYEAITARARVGLLPMPAKRKQSRVVRAVDDVVAGRFAMRYNDWNNGAGLSLAQEPLHEAARCADVVLERFFGEGLI
jgi:uncharacterized protein